MRNFASVSKDFGSFLENNFLIPLSVLFSLWQWLPWCSQIIALSEPFLVTETGKHDKLH
jgi:hypothetical protein